MSFFIAKNEGHVDRLMDSDMLMKIAPDYYRPKFEAIAEMRSLDDGTLHKGNGFRRVASLVNIPLANAAGLLDPAWMKEKKRFYAWLDRGENKRYCTYDRRNRASRQAMFEKEFGHLFKEVPVADKFTVNTTPTPEGPGTVWASTDGAKMPTEATGPLNHVEDPGAQAPGIGIDSSNGTFKGCKSNPGIDNY